MDQQTLIITIIISSVGLMVMLGGAAIAVTVIMRPKVLLKRRMSQIGMYGEKTSDSSSADKSSNRRQKRIQDKIKEIEKKGDQKKGIDGLKESILRAGLDLPLKIYFVLSACLGVFLTLVYLLSGLPVIGALPVLILGFLGIPRYVLHFLAKSRQKQFTKNFADAVDLVVRGIRSGLPINECFSIVAREFEDPIGGEFRLIVEGQKLGLTLEDILERGLRRIPTPEFKFFAIVTQIQKQTGGNLADTLSNLSNVLRERKKMRDKAKAMSAEAKASAGIIGSLPIAVGLMLSVVSPDYVALLFTETAGNYMLMGGAFWMFCGTMVMKQMINFDM